MTEISRVFRTKESAQTAYDRMSRFYDLFASSSERRFTTIGLQMLAPQIRENILEIGFGTGHSLVALAQAVGKSGKVTGIDLSGGMRDVANSRIKKSGVDQQVDLHQGDAVNLPFKTSNFDAVFASFTLELFDSPEIPRVLDECWRVLVPGGRIGVVSLLKKDIITVKIYEWFHAKFPTFVDCRPIILDHILYQTGFRSTAICERRMWGLPVQMTIATKISRL
jgi:ubiquinone/menaquinone biosynthesis C-methylase UbiE